MSAMNGGCCEGTCDSEEPDHASGYDYRFRYREVGFSGSWRRMEERAFAEGRGPDPATRDNVAAGGFVLGGDPLEQ
jgi:hypothetical protein